MADENIVSTLRELPRDATNGKALAWVNRMRLLLDRWDTLPDSANRSMTPELKRQAYSELDDVEASVRRNMTPMEAT
jgi:hypothetical protein